MSHSVLPAPSHSSHTVMLHWCNNSTADGFEHNSHACSACSTSPTDLHPLLGCSATSLQWRTLGVGCTEWASTSLTCRTLSCESWIRTAGGNLLDEGVRREDSFAGIACYISSCPCIMCRFVAFLPPRTCRFSHCLAALCNNYITLYPPGPALPCTRRPSSAELACTWWTESPLSCIV